jgi:hypothetical protein
MRKGKGGGENGEILVGWKGKVVGRQEENRCGQRAERRKRRMCTYPANVAIGIGSLCFSFVAVRALFLVTSRCTPNNPLFHQPLPKPRLQTTPSRATSPSHEAPRKLSPDVFREGSSHHAMRRMQMPCLFRHHSCSATNARSSCAAPSALLLARTPPPPAPAVPPSSASATTSSPAPAPTA